MKQIIFGLITGLLFGAGLTISTMVDPQRVLAFLDILGDWDPTLLFVMVGGLLVYLPFYYGFIHKRKMTCFGEQCDIPSNTTVDFKLLLGASLFGIGWGLSGICPGPALTNLSAMNPSIIVFIVLMLIGFFIASKLESYFKN